MYDVICHYDFRIIDAKKNNVDCDIFSNLGFAEVTNTRK